MSLQVLELHGLPTKSYSRAVQEFLARQYDIHKTNTLIAMIDDRATPIADLQTAHYACAYMIQEVVKVGDVATPPHYFESALKHAQELKDRMPEVAPLYNGAPLHRIDEDGNIIETKRGSSGVSALERARELFTANPDLDRQAIQTMFVDQLGIAATTASSYYWSLTKATDATTGSDSGPTTTRPPKAARTKKVGERRADQIKRVFDSRPSWSNRAELLDAVIAETGCSRAAANTFSYTVMPSTKPKGKAK